MSMVGFLLPVPLPRRQPTNGPRANGLRGLSLCCPLSHLLVVIANTLQLAMMVVFPCLLLVCLDGIAPLAWCHVFTPLWISDFITLTTGAHELYKVLRAAPEAFA